MRDIKLANLRICLEVLNRGNLTAAAQALNLTQGAVSKSVQLVETQLGVPLFRRNKNGMDAYDYARACLFRVAEGIGIVDAALADLSAADGHGTLRIVAPPIIVQHFIIPHLADFNKRHPEIELLFRVRTGVARKRADTDAEIKFYGDAVVPSGAQWLIGERFWVIRHPDVGPARLPLEKVVSYPLLQHIQLESAWLDLATRYGLSFATTKFHYYEQYNLIIDATLQKQGIAIVPRFLVSDLVKTGRLRRVGREIVFPKLGYYFHPVRREKAAASRKLFVWLQQLMRQADVG